MSDWHLAELDREKAYADSMSASAHYWMDRARAAERSIAIIVHAAGGKVEVFRSSIENAQNLVLERTERHEDMATVFRAKVK